MDKPVLSKQAFWDVDMDKIDYKKQALFVMENMINNGSWDDVLTIMRFYGEKKIGKTIINTKVFGPKEINFCCLIFKLNLQDFKYPANRPAYLQWDYSGA